MSSDLKKYYELLGVAPGTSGRELKDAYRDLAKVWHPDRFSHDPRLQQKAQEKLKEINEAYERLSSGRAARPKPQPATPKPRTSAQDNPRAHAATTVAHSAARRRHTRHVLPITLVFCAAFFAAYVSLTPKGARPAPEQAPTDGQAKTQTSDKEQQPDGPSRNAATQPARGKERQSVDERTGRQAAEEAKPLDESGASSGVPRVRPMQTVTVSIDAVTGMLATRDCPNVSRVTYPAGNEPRQYCNVQHKTKVAPQDTQARPNGSVLKSAAKRLAAPFN
ncbi:MAG TPA: J domain-containing protein [Pyrinomonadaceae bacterium]|nr:J domain-containing protein [Pyrinomonadaceae bacterium]